LRDIFFCIRLIGPIRRIGLIVIQLHSIEICIFW
jgi:hypothetical protein